jgi:hypothetical protein
MVAVSRPPDWTETADWLGIHYMAAIRAAKNLAVEYQARDFTAVVLACPLRNNDGFVFATEMVATKIAFDPYPRDAIVLHIIGIDHTGEPRLLPDYYRTEDAIHQRITAVTQRRAAQGE